MRSKLIMEDIVKKYFFFSEEMPFQLINLNIALKDIKNNIRQYKLRKVSLIESL